MTPQERAAVLRRASADAAVEWWTDPAQLAELWRWLEEQGREPTDPPHFMECPWRWDPEYQDMRREQTRP
jgi:hypothetical protein